MGATQPGLGIPSSFNQYLNNTEFLWLSDNQILSIIMVQLYKSVFLLKLDGV